MRGLSKVAKVRCTYKVRCTFRLERCRIRIAYCVLRIAYCVWRMEFCYLRIAYWVLHIPYYILHIPCYPEGFYAYCVLRKVYNIISYLHRNENLIMYPSSTGLKPTAKRIKLFRNEVQEAKDFAYS